MQCCYHTIWTISNILCHVWSPVHILIIARILPSKCRWAWCKFRTTRGNRENWFWFLLIGQFWIPLYFKDPDLPHAVFFFNKIHFLALTSTLRMLNHVSKTSHESPFCSEFSFWGHLLLCGISCASGKMCEERESSIRSKTRIIKTDHV